MALIVLLMFLQEKMASKRKKRSKLFSMQSLWHLHSLLAKTRLWSDCNCLLRRQYTSKGIFGNVRHWSGSTSVSIRVFILAKEMKMLFEKILSDFFWTFRKKPQNSRKIPKKRKQNTKKLKYRQLPRWLNENSIFRGKRVPLKNSLSTIKYFQKIENTGTFLKYS